MMSKNKETRAIEHALVKHTARIPSASGALEVTLNWTMHAKDYDRVDYIEIVDHEIACYEIKVSMSDLESDNVLSFVGNKNYLVVPLSMANNIVLQQEKHDGTKLNKIIHQLWWRGIGIIGVNLDDLSIHYIKRCKKNVKFH